MVLRDGVSRRQVPQLKNKLKEGVSITEISRDLQVMPEVIFTFAKGWGIPLKETPESVELQKYEGIIKAEVKRRVADELSKKKFKAPVSKTAINAERSAL